MCAVRYNIYPTLLDGYLAYKRMEDKTDADLLAIINRTEGKTEQMVLGTAFNDLIDHLCDRKPFEPVDGVYRVNKEGYLTGGTGFFEFPEAIVRQFVGIYRQSVRQVFLEGVLPTRRGHVRLYGFADGVFPSVVRDIKTTSRYTSQKYFGHVQAYAYTYCVRYMGGRADGFWYDATDFKGIYHEYYAAETLGVDYLVNVCEDFIGWCEERREFITAPKLFSQQ